MKFDLIEVLTRAAKITWKYKVLWVFGILASCGRSSGGGSNSSGGGNGDISSSPLSPEMMRQLEDFGTRIAAWFEQNLWVILAFLLVALILILLQVFLSLTGTAGLIRGVVRAESGAEVIPFGELFSESLLYFWRLLGAALVIWTPVFVLGILASVAVVVPMAVNEASPEASGSLMILLVVGLCCCLLPVSIVLSLYHLQVKRSIAVDNMGILQALGFGWQVLTKNIIAMLIVGFVLFIVNAVIGTLISLPILLLILPLMAVILQGNITSWGPFIPVGILALFYSPFAWFATGLLTTYTESAWTLTYLRVTKPAETTPALIDENA